MTTTNLVKKVAHASRGVHMSVGSMFWFTWVVRFL